VSSGACTLTAKRATSRAWRLVYGAGRPAEGEKAGQDPPEGALPQRDLEEEN